MAAADLGGRSGPAGANHLPLHPWQTTSSSLTMRSDQPFVVPSPSPKELSSSSPSRALAMSSIVEAMFPPPPEEFSRTTVGEPPAAGRSARLRSRPFTSRATPASVPDPLCEPAWTVT